MLSVDAAALAPRLERRGTWTSHVAVSALAITTLALSWSSDTPVALFCDTVLSAQVVPALCALAFLVTYYSGGIDVSIGGSFAVVLVIIGAPDTSSDLVILASVILGCLLTFLVRIGSWRLGPPGIVSFIATFAFTGLAFLIAGSSGQTADTSDSIILRGVATNFAGLPLSVWITIAAVVYLTWFFGMSTVGQQIRAFGISPSKSTAALVNPMKVIAIAAAIAGVLVTVAAVVALSASGTSAPSSGNRLFLFAPAAAVLGNGGLARLRPAPARVALAALLLGFLERQLIAYAWTPEEFELLVGAIALFAMIPTADRRTRYHAPA